MSVHHSFGRPLTRQPATREPSLAARLGPSGECQAQRCGRHIFTEPYDDPELWRGYAEWVDTIGQHEGDFR